MGTLAFEAAAPPPPSMSSNLSDAMRRQVQETAQAQAVGDQFEYRIGQPVTIRRNESALLPIIQAEVEGEKVSLYNGTETNPRLAFWLKNSSGLTLDAGAVTLIDTNAFAGEGLIETLQPGESRLVSYALDLGSQVSTTIGSDRQRVQKVIINRGMISMHSKMVEKKTYTIRNNNDKPRTLVLEHPVREGWKLLTAVPVETSANFYRFKTEVKPKSTSEFIVEEESPMVSTFAVSSVTPEQIGVWVTQRSIDPEIERSLRVIADKKNEISELDGKLAALAREQSDIFQDQERVRSNIQRLTRDADENTLRQRYIDKLNSQEDRLAGMQAEREKLDAARTSAQEQLDKLIQNLSIDKPIS